MDKAREGLFIRTCSDRPSRNGFTLKESRFRLDTKKKFFAVSVVRHQDRLPRETVDVLLLEGFKWKVSLLMVRGLDLGRFQLKQFHGSLILSSGMKR